MSRLQRLNGKQSSNVGRTHRKTAKERPGKDVITAAILVASERVFAESGLAGATMAKLAAVAGLPKANLHYYFATKDGLYASVLENILIFWLAASDQITDDAHPATALPAYIRAKLALSRDRPYASKVFANEVLHGAGTLGGYLGTELRRKVDEKSAILEGWIAKGLMAPVDPRHLLFLLWAMTQTYADFDVQMCAVLGKTALDTKDFATAEATIIDLVLRGCGVVPALRAARGESTLTTGRQA